MDWTRIDAVAEELAATRAEVLALVMLVLGGVVVAWAVVDRPVGTPAPEVVDVTVASPTPVATTSSPTRVMVHVTGAVAAAGVVELPAGARVVDAVTAAGGATRDAGLDALNLARAVLDGEHVHVLTRDEVAAGAVVAADPQGGDGAGGADGDVHDDQGRLDLQRASTADLEELPGVGPVIAQRIVDWRDANGGFEAVAQLREVSGIGERTFQSLADLVVVR